MRRDTDKEYCRILFDTLIRQGVETVVSSPGSRNIPLLLAAEARKDNLRNIIIADERTASFVALGIALATKRPVALCCTSGTAMLNYAPAVAEAYYQGVPLILLTADRPIQWIDQDDSQTIRQFNCLANIVKASFDIHAPTVETDEDRWYVRRIAADAILQASASKRGPVHINVQIDAPIGGTIEYHPAVYSAPVISNCSSALSSPDIIEKAAGYMAGKKTLIVCGFSSDGEKLSEPLRRLAAHPSIQVLAENIANVHLPYDATAIDSLFVCMDASDKEAAKPDIVISTGGALISRMLKEFLRAYSPRQHWHIGHNNSLIDCFKALTANICASSDIFFSMLADRLDENTCASEEDYSQIWDDIRSRSIRRRALFLKSECWSELLAFKEIIEQAPEEYAFFFSNGTPIRYSQLFRQTPGRLCFCNRGVSGIEGTNATAAGMAMANRFPVVLVTGDLSFSYDTGILGLADLPDDFRIIVINNNGGGIFRFVRQSRNLDDRERFFAANNSIPVRGLADAYGWNYFCADSAEEFPQLLGQFFATPRALLEIKVDVDMSAEILNCYLSPDKPQ